MLMRPPLPARRSTVVTDMVYQPPLPHLRPLPLSLLRPSPAKQAPSRETAAR